MKVNSVQSLLGIWVAVLGLSSCAASRRGAYDVRPRTVLRCPRNARLLPITGWTTNIRFLSTKTLIQ